MKFKKFLMALGLLCCASAFAAEPSSAHPQVEIQTNHGSFVVELYPEKAPKTVANFLEYVANNFYPGTVFHRTINRFMIQGGGLTAELKEKTSMQPSIKTGLTATSKENVVLPPISNESNNGLKNERGTLAMARTFEPDSATSQFFINLEDNKFLNYYKPDPHYIGYCVFGKVIRGMDVVEKIGQLPTKSVGQYTDVPQQAVIIEKVALLEKPIEAGTMPESPNKSKSSKPASKGKKRGQTTH
jgi:peptidyl-prolyl cis-trans isomerase A (cyclophilin A)